MVVIHIEQLPESTRQRVLRHWQDNTRTLAEVLHGRYLTRKCGRSYQIQWTVDAGEREVLLSEGWLVVVGFPNYG
jgi:hypothetical protein